jgi:hypothetical protein
MDQPFLLVSNAARESRVLITVILWVVVALPLVGLICWRVFNTFGPNAASIVGAVLSIALIVVVVVGVSGKKRYTLIVAPEVIRVFDGKGTLIESLAARGLEFELACHVYTGRPSLRIPVVVLRDKTHEVTIGANSSREPPATTREVPAPRFLVEEESELSRLTAALAAVRATGR